MNNILHEYYVKCAFNCMPTNVMLRVIRPTNVMLIVIRPTNVMRIKFMPKQISL